jgi:hypothetical protein
MLFVFFASFLQVVVNALFMLGELSILGFSVEEDESDSKQSTSGASSSTSSSSSASGLEGVPGFTISEVSKSFKLRIPGTYNSTFNLYTNIPYTSTCMRPKLCLNILLYARVHLSFCVCIYVYAHLFVCICIYRRSSKPRADVDAQFSSTRRGRQKCGRRRVYADDDHGDGTLATVSIIIIIIIIIFVCIFVIDDGPVSRDGASARVCSDGQTLSERQVPCQGARQRLPQGAPCRPNLLHVIHVGCNGEGC